MTITVYPRYGRFHRILGESDEEFEQYKQEEREKIKQSKLVLSTQIATFDLVGLKRKYHRFPPLAPGQQFFRPANPNDPSSTPSRPVTVIDQVQNKSFYNNRHYSDGLWNVRCFCGQVYQVKAAYLNRLCPNALHCPRPECADALPRKRRSQTFRTRPGALRHLNQTYGRLFVVSWVEREGWLCRCTCGTDQLVRRSALLAKEGYRRCPHV